MRAVNLPAAVDVFRAIADPTRRALLEQLSHAECSVSDLAGPFRMTQPAISQHLRVLLDAGLVRATEIGRQRVYHLDARPLREVYDWASRYRELFTDPSGHVWRLSAGRGPAARGRWAPRRKRRQS